MITTEAEARNKYCPQYAYRGTCVGSECMAWKEASPINEYMLERDLLMGLGCSLGEAETKAKLTKKSGRGYCGLANFS